MSKKSLSPLETVMAINAAELRLRQAMLGADIGALDTLLADDLIFVDPQGQVIDKTADLAAHRSARLKLDRIELSETEIRPLGETALVVTRAALQGSFDGVGFAGDFRYSRIWRNGETGWQVVAGHCSAII